MFEVYRIDHPDVVSEPLSGRESEFGSRDQTLYDSIVAILGGIALSMVPIFSYRQNFSDITQAYALILAVPAILALRHGVRIPAPVLWYVAFAIFAGLNIVTLVNAEAAREGYISLVKVALLSTCFALIIRSPGQLLLVFLMYSLSTIPTTVLNWDSYLQVRSIGDAQQNDSNRLAGSFSNPNALSNYTLISAFCSMAFWHNSRSKWRHVVLLSLPVLATLNLYSGSRKGLIGIGVLFFLWMVVLMRDRKSGASIKLLKGSLTVMIGVVCAMTILNSLFFSRLERFALDPTAGDSGRMDLLVYGLEFWLEHPVLGWGFDQFRAQNGIGKVAHNSFVEALANHGLLGCVLYLMPFLVMGAKAWSSTTNAETTQTARLNSWCFALICLSFYVNQFGVAFAQRDLWPLTAAAAGFLYNRDNVARWSKFQEAHNPWAPVANGAKAEHQF